MVEPDRAAHVLGATNVEIASRNDPRVAVQRLSAERPLEYRVDDDAPATLSCSWS
jgi:hypothetical protein